MDSLPAHRPGRPLPDHRLRDPQRRRVLRAAAALAIAPAGPAWIAGCAAPSAAQAPPWPRARVLLLGEIHDNPHHHRLRAEGLARLLADGRPTAVLFEPMDRLAADRIDAVVAEAQPEVSSGDAARLAAAADRVADAGGLDRKAWAWPLHRPLVEAALRGGARLGGANLTTAQARGIVRGGLAAAPADVRALIAADPAWTPARQDTLEGLIDTGHCGLLPRSAWGPMVLAQRARDAAMALAVDAALRGVGGPASERVVLVAGNGHVRRDIGVPHHLAALPQPPAARDIVAVAYLEAGTDEPRDATLYDQVVITPQQDRPDPCEGLRRPRSG